MSYAGFQVFQGNLNWFTSILIAGTGSAIGISISYVVGFKLGSPFFQKYGHRFHLGPDRLEKTSVWFEKYGAKVLIIAYFIPGIRHITGYFSGITRMPYRSFSLYAYVGAFLWVSTFISLGKILGPQWEQFHDSVKKYLVIGSIIVGIILAIVYIYRNYKLKLKDMMLNTLNKAEELLHSLRRVKMILIGMAVIFLSLSFVMIGLIQDYFSNEFEQFDRIVMLLVNLIFNEDWSSSMKLFSSLSSSNILFAILFLTLIVILMKSKERLLDSLFLVITVVGGELIEEVLRNILSSTFPNEQSFISVVVYGFVAFLIFRHTDNYIIRTITVFIFLLITLLIGLSHLFFQLQYPSDIVAGYVFGGVWLSLILITLESFRLLRKV